MVRRLPLLGLGTVLIGYLLLLPASASPASLLLVLPIATLIGLSILGREADDVRIGFLDHGENDLAARTGRVRIRQLQLSVVFSVATTLVLLVGGQAA